MPDSFHLERTHSESSVISRLRGTLLSRDFSLVEIETAGGVVYEVEVPLTVDERLPAIGEPLELLTVYVVREESTALYGFLEPVGRELFKRLLKAKGVGPHLAMAMLSAFSPRRLAQALAEKDLVALSQVSGVGKKTAERIALELSEKVRDLALSSDTAPGIPPGAEGALSALVALGYSVTAANAAIREALKKSRDLSTEELIREALAGR
jgi:Holliday junction DNA helicase RuvA